MASRRIANPHEPRRVTRTIPATHLVALLLAFVLVAATGGVLAAGLAIPFAAATSTATEEGVKLFDDVPDEIKPGPLSQVSTVYAADGTRLATFYAQNRIVVPLDQVSQAMKDAVISIEDERFYEHTGVDVRGVLRAAVNNATGGPQQGASTLTQQYVKNVLIDQAQQSGDPFGIIDARKDSNARKVREMKYAIALEQEMTKDEILEGYLNVAQFGHNNIYGVETAARYFFNKSAKDLTPVEAATIAGITKAPGKFDPTIDPELSQQRRDAVLYKMWSLGKLPQDEYDAARATPIADTLHITPVPTGCQSAGGSAFFCAYVIQTIKNSPAFGETEAERLELLYRGGLSITTTLDLRMQMAAEEQVNAHIPVDNTAGLESVVVTVEPGTGKILAMAQNTPFDANNPPADGHTSVNYATDPKHGASKGFQPGSNFKPFVLAEWLKSGRTLNSVVSASKVDRPHSAWSASCRSPFSSRETWGPANAEGNLTGNISVLKATYDSVNTAYAAMGLQLDLCSLAQTAWDMGFRPTQGYRPGEDGMPRSVTLFDPQPEDVFVTPSMLIGTQTTSPLDLAAAYATLASNGTYCTPIALTRVVGPDGEEIPVPAADCNPDALAPNIAATTTYALQQVFEQGTARRTPLSDGRPAAGKTGTNQLSAQTWFTGFTPQLSTTVWVGEASGETSHLDIDFQGRRIRPLYGSTLAAPLWRDYMDIALAAYPAAGFPEPDPALVGTPARPKPAATKPARPAASATPAPPAAPAEPAAPPEAGPDAGADPGAGNPGEGGDGGGGGEN